MNDSRRIWHVVFATLLAGGLASCNLADDEPSLVDTSGDVMCAEDSCADNATCSVESGEIVCACGEGYAGEACDTCATGYQDNDGDGTCAADCASAALDCGDNGACSDASGAAACACTDGYTGADCSVAPGCDAVDLDCGEHGACSDTDGAPVCACDMGYTGATCDACATGYQDTDGDGTCLMTCETAGLECGEGTCSTVSGSPACECPDNKAGEGCTACADGYQDNDGDGVCTENCTSAGLDCGANGVCDDSSGAVACTCNEGWAGEVCDTCAQGLQDDDGNGTCTVACENAPWWDTGYAYRAAFQVDNSAATDSLFKGSMAGVRIDHAMVAADGRALASGDDVRVVYWDGTTHVEVPRHSANWNAAMTRIAFMLQADIAGGATSSGYWLYWGNNAATTPPVLSGPWATDVDNGRHLGADRIKAGFRSIQFRQVTPGSPDFEVFNNEHTGDGSSFGRIKVTDSNTGAVLFENRYGELGGSCCNPVKDGELAEAVTLSAAEFTVELESDEYSNSYRYFGASGYRTSHPDGAETTVRKFTTTPTVTPAAFCGL